MNDEWYTPSYVIEKARKVLGTIDTDPASCEFANRTVKAKTFYTKEDSGLECLWDGNVWCNPPYSPSLIKRFTEEFRDQYELGIMKQGIILTNSGTDTLWNQNLKDGIQAYTIGRISFIQPDGTEKGKGGRGQVFTYFGDNSQLFIDTFTEDNFCWIPNLKETKWA